AGPASDVFSLGCVLAYAATGGPPFGGENPASVLFRIVSAEPDLSPVPPRLRQVIEACLKKDPALRPEPARVIAMINSLGPETQATLGSFWPDNVARVIATVQAGQTPAGLTPPAAPSYAGSGGMPGSAGVASGATGVAAPPAAERTPTALATPAPGQGGGGATGHAPMISDGYYAAAAQGRSTPTPAPAGSSIPPLSASPQSYAGPPPYAPQGPGAPMPDGPMPGGPMPGGPMPGGQPPTWQAGYGQAVFGQTGLGTPAPYPAQFPSYPGQQPNSADALPQYTMGRRKPMTAEVPPNVRTAIRLMYIGFVVTALDLLLSLMVLGRYAHDGNAAKKAADSALTARRAATETALMHNQNTMAGAMAIGVVAAVLGLGCWAWLAMATRRGNGWTRIAGTVLLAIYSVCTLIVLFGTHRDPGTQFTTVVVWAIGVAAVIPLWSRQARDFCYAWRKR
ncbi:MAG: hypothetical protein ACRDP7_46840, partial [Trebonia sp.]